MTSHLGSLVSIPPNTPIYTSSFNQQPWGKTQSLTTALVVDHHNTFYKILTSTGTFCWINSSNTTRIAHHETQTDLPLAHQETTSTPIMHNKK
jgi:hypothetical protein